MPRIQQHWKNVWFLIAMLLLGTGIFAFETRRRMSQVYSFRARQCVSSILEADGPIEAYVPILRDQKAVTVTDRQLKKKVGELLRWGSVRELPHAPPTTSGGSSIEIVHKGTGEPFIRILGNQYLLIGFHEQNNGFQYLCNLSDPLTIDKVAQLLGVEWHPVLESD